MFAELYSTRIASLMAVLLCLTACSSVPKVLNPDLPPSQMIESADLADTERIAQELAKQVGKDQVLVIYDLDNTLLAMEQDLGSDQWYYWQKELQEADKCDPRVVSDRLAAQGALYFASAMRTTQPDAAEVVRTLQDQGFKSIIITSRGLDFAPASFRELRRNGLDFSILPLGSGEVLQFKPTAGSRETLYESGVFLTAGQDKGVMLLALLQATQSALPQAIVMADDKVENLQNVLNALANQPVSVQALRYNREDARVATFDAAHADAQWQRVEPALRQLQAVFGEDNFRLPEPVRLEGCPATRP